MAISARPPMPAPGLRGQRGPRGLGVGWSALILTLAMSACGKKGPPLPPVVHVPSAVGQMTARRVGDDVFLTLTMPTQNVDGSTPVDLGRVEVYGYTGPSSPSPARFTAVATLVGSIEVTTRVDVATLRDALTPDARVAGALPAGAAGSIPVAGTAKAGTDGPLTRFYVAVTFSPRGRAGPPSAVLGVGLTPVPDPPPEVRATYTEQAAILAWEPSGGLIGFLLDRARPLAASPLDDAPPPAQTGAPSIGPTRYNVYRETAVAPSPSPTVEGGRGLFPPRPLNEAPLETRSFSEPVQLDGIRRCYVVRAVRGSGDRTVEGRPSRPACITPEDTFPPAPPTGVSPIAAEGAVSLVWETNREADLRGYMVLRGEAGDATLTPVSDVAIAENRFTDRSVRAGVRYVYAVTAVDTRLPVPNVSAESERVEVTAR